MSHRPLFTLKYYFRIFLYLIVFNGFSISHAGSFEDYFKAIRVDDAAEVRALLQRGFDVNTLNDQGEHGLVLAVRQSSLKVAAVLLGWPKINVEMRTRQDESALMLAALKGLTALCVQLINMDADVNKPGWTPLHYAASQSQLAVMNLLIEHSAYLDAASPNGTTPLMMAAKYGNASAVKLLLEAGADPSVKNELALTALDFAQQAQRLDSAAIISAFIRGKQPKGSW
jgi:ankyrin repeat protein